MRKWILRFVLLGLIILALGLWVTRPRTLPSDALAGLEPDLANGELVFHAGGCASCHAAPGAEGAERLVLSGGRNFPSPFGTFLAPNISPSKSQGIGDWSARDLANAMIHGTSPEGRHYYPAFPYASYTRADPRDIVDLHAYLMTLPASDVASQPHEVGFPFNIRASLGGWKLLFLRDTPMADMPDAPEHMRGQYLVEALGHCGECHTPRNALGGMRRDAWLSGAPNPAGRGSFPDLTPPKMSWSDGELVEYFTSGFTPEFDSAGGHMAEVVENLSHLPIKDREAIAAYIKALPGG